METKKYKALEDVEVSRPVEGADAELVKAVAGEEIELTDAEAATLEGKVELVA